MEKPRSGKMKHGLIGCIVVIVCLLAFSGWTYLRINDLQKQANELEAQNGQLQTQVADLETQVSSLETEVENLTNSINNMTFTFMGAEQLEIQGCTFSGTSGDATNTIVLTVQNTGTADLTVDQYKLGVGGTAHDIANVAVDQGDSTTVTCTTGADGEAWTSGTTYDIYLITSTGKQFPYRATAP